MNTKVMNTEEDLLTTEELLLLELLTYYVESDGKTIYNSGKYKPEMTVEDYLIQNRDDYTDDSIDYGSGMSMHDMEQIRDAILVNEEFKTIRNMKIMELHTDTAEGGGEGKSILFVSDETGEAVVAFRGTEKDEWVDNFYGGGATSAKDGVSTPQQENALAWYKEIYKEYGLEDYYVTLTGHSKGDNKATYTAILDDTVDRCVGYDGQGMSDEFMWVYAEEIVARQGCIEHHNVNYDFVNPLLNVIGKSTYYEGQNVDSFVENHSPNSLLKFGENGKVTMANVADGRPYEMEVLDRFLNSFLRSLDKEDKQVFLALIGDVAHGFVYKEDREYFENLLSRKENEEVVAYFFDYLGQYHMGHPELIESVKTYLKENDLNEVYVVLGIIIIMPLSRLLTKKHIGELANGFGLTGFDGNVIEIFEEIDFTHGIDLDANIVLQIRERIKEYLEPLQSLLTIIYIKYIDIISKVSDTIFQEKNVLHSSGGKKHFYVSTTHLHDGICFLEEASLHVDKAYKNLAGISLYGINDANVRKSLEEIKYQLNQENRECNELTKALIGIKRIYESEEQLLHG